MDEKQFRMMKRQMKNHGPTCYKCGRSKRNGCYSSGCLVQHCACAMTDPEIHD